MGVEKSLISNKEPQVAIDPCLTLVAACVDNLSFSKDKRSCGSAASGYTIVAFDRTWRVNKHTPPRWPYVLEMPRNVEWTIFIASAPERVQVAT